MLSNCSCFVLVTSSQLDSYQLSLVYLLPRDVNKPQNGLFQKRVPWNFSFFYFTPGNSGQNKAQPLDIPQNCVRSLGNFKAKNKDPWKFHIIFSWSPFEIPLRFNSTCYFFDTPGNSISSKPPCLDFFWKSPIASYLTSDSFLSFINNYC